MDQYVGEFRTFRHGLFHGFVSALTILLPVTAVNALFGRKYWKYIWLNWVICVVIMGVLSLHGHSRAIS